MMMNARLSLSIKLHQEFVDGCRNIAGVKAVNVDVGRVHSLLAAHKNSRNKNPRERSVSDAFARDISTNLFEV